MNWKRQLYQIACAALVLCILIGGIRLLQHGDTVEPENPIRPAAEQVLAEMLKGGSAAENTEQSTEDGEISQAQDSGDPDSEQPPQEQTQIPPKETAQEPYQEHETVAGEDASPEDRGDPDQSGEGGEGELSGQGDAEGGSGDGEGDGEEGMTIVTSLKGGTVTQPQLPDGKLDFTAYGSGGDDLTVKVTVRRGSDAARKQTTLVSTDDLHYHYTMSLGETYYFTFYLYQNGTYTGTYITRTVTYQAMRADAEHPEVGEYPPSIETNFDRYADGDTIPNENAPLIITVRSNPDGRIITADRIEVRLNGVLVTKDTGDSNPEYNLHFEPPNVGDEKEYTIEITAWDGNNSTYWSKKLVYRAAAEGDVIGTVRVVLDATAVGLGILDEGEYEITKGQTAKEILLQFLEDNGYSADYQDGAGFYLRGISRGDMCRGASVPAELWNLILRDGISTEGFTHDRDSLSEFDYTKGSGWMYSINSSYPGRSMGNYELTDGDTIYLRFTLAYGKDIGGYESAGGAYGNLSSYCGEWVNGGFRARSHDYVETERIAPTATENGRIVYTCSRCGNVMEELLPATGVPEEPALPTEPDTPEKEPEGEGEPTEGGNDE